MMPVPIVAGQPRGLQGEDGADTPGTHRCQQLAKTRALVTSRSAPADVLIDHDDLGKPQTASLIRQGILPPLAFGVRAHLMARGLADIDVGVPLEMDRVN